VPLAAAFLACLIGCNPAANKGPTAGGKPDEHAHEHAHHGPHGGHMMEIGEEEFHAEWTHDDATGKVTFYILDAEAKKEVPIQADDLTIEVKIGNNEPATYTLPAVNPQDGKSAVFETTNQNLEGALAALSERVTAKIKKLTIGDKTFENLNIEEHKHEGAH
jgi:hypothetical protein